MKQKLLRNAILLNENITDAELAIAGITREEFDAAPYAKEEERSSAMTLDPEQEKLIIEEVMNEEWHLRDQTLINWKDKTVYKPDYHYIRKPSDDEKEIHKEIQEWVVFSMKQHTNEEIRNRILEDPMSVCYTYLCEYCELQEDFIPEFAALSTGLLNKKTYDKWIEKIIKAWRVAVGLDDGRISEDVICFICKKKKSEIDERDYRHAEIRLQDRLSWNAIYLRSRDNLSEEFKRKYVSLLITKEGITCQEIRKLSS